MLLGVAPAACSSQSTVTQAHGPGTVVTMVPTLPTTTAPEPVTTTSTPPATSPATTAATTPKTAPRTVPAPTPTAAPTIAPTIAPTTRPSPVTGGGVAIGDSVLEDVQIYAKDTLASKGISFNVAVGRQWNVGVTIVAQLKASGKLPPVVIVGLGSNGVVKPAQFDQMMQAAAGAQRVVFMTVTGPLVGNNPVITAGVARYPKAALADWAALAAAHPEWFGSDHVHVGPAGATALGNLLASKV